MSASSQQHHAASGADYHWDFLGFELQLRCHVVIRTPTARLSDHPTLRVPGWPSVRVALKRPEEKGRSPGFCYFENKLLGETVRRTVLLVSGRTIGDRRLL